MWQASLLPLPLLLLLEDLIKVQSQHFVEPFMGLVTKQFLVFFFLLCSFAMKSVSVFIVFVFEQETAEGMSIHLCFKHLSLIWADDNDMMWNNVGNFANGIF